ncbi:DUF1015 family protein [Segeticoccus rhizosphaerae]|uniref:DUF1015 family protein n=1 Tax=Segeticoccus rhizosphaerae TaxID=1104777 RepID=UPI00192E36DE|nr:DUF1015 domain-containing protein [Ornithinicoccus soli]
MTTPETGLALLPFRATRYAGSDHLGDRLSPPYDVISEADREDLVGASDTSAVRLILPAEAEGELADGDAYAGARALMDGWVHDGVLAVDAEPALYVYEMTAGDAVTRGLLGAVELHDPEDGVILPHENTMAGPVADRLALMEATEANLEPIYLVYDGGGAASELVASVGDQVPLAEAQTPDGTIHRLWAVTDPKAHAAVADDLAARRAVIADGHHRYATYRKLQAEHDGEPGPWDLGLTLLVDTTAYGPQVHPIHRVVAIGFDAAVEAVRAHAKVGEPVQVGEAARQVAEAGGFAVALAQGDRAVVVCDLDRELVSDTLGDVADSALGRLDVTVVHRVLVERLWGLADTEESVGYAHDVQDALEAAGSDRTAVLLRPTPVEDLGEVARAGERMPRKSTLFTPKPASGMVIRRFADQG